jgi:hypothetical protein
MFRVLSVVLLAALVTACGSPSPSIYNAPDGKTLIVTKQDWADFQAYLAKIGNTHSGAFAMGVYGGASDGWASSYCEHDVCYGGKSSVNSVMDTCRQSGECVLFARNREILVNYKIQGE